MPLAEEARKPMFALMPADDALGGHANAVRDCYRKASNIGCYKL